jgi:hypothetical protein
MRLKTSGEPQELSLRAREPGLYEAKLDPSLTGVQELEVVDAEGKVVHIERFVVPPPEERRHRTPDLLWLQDLAQRTGGTFDVKAVTPTLSAASTPEHLRLWPYAVLFAGAVVPPRRSAPPHVARGVTQPSSRRTAKYSRQRAWSWGLWDAQASGPARVEPKIELRIEAVRDQHVEPLEVAAVVLLAVPQVEQRPVDVPDAPAHVREQTIRPALEVGARTERSGARP